MRYYLALGLTLAVACLVLGAIQLVSWWGNVDVTIPIKELNQQIAPAALFCPEAYYPRDIEFECTIEGASGRVAVKVRTVQNSIEFVSPELAQNAINRVTGL